MKSAEYHSLLDSLPYGKRLPGAVYLLDSGSASSTSTTTARSRALGLAPEATRNTIIQDIPFQRALEPLLRVWPSLLALIALLILTRLLRSARIKGRLGERAVARALSRLDPATYTSFHDLYLPRPDEQGTTQIDHIVVSPFGIFVIETKNHRGRIFGSKNQAEWTQQIYKDKYSFQNPLHQNNLHVRALMGFLDLPESAFHSIVFFVGGCQLKPPMPPNVLDRGLRRWIEDHRDLVLVAEQVARARKSLANHERSTDRRSAARLHLKAMKQRA